MQQTCAVSGYFRGMETIQLTINDKLLRKLKEHFQDWASNLTNTFEQHSFDSDDYISPDELGCALTIYYSLHRMAGIRYAIDSILDDWSNEGEVVKILVFTSDGDEAELNEKQYKEVERW